MKLEFFSVKTPLITSSDSNITKIILKAIKSSELDLKDYDVLIIASKIISMAEGRKIERNKIKPPREQAIELAKIAKLDKLFVEVVFQESDVVIGAVPGAVLALRDGVLQANAGVDQSNSGGEDFIILLPVNSFISASKIRNEIYHQIKKKVGVIIADSKTHPLRRGTSGFALGVSGILPVIDDRGKKDLFGRTMRITTRALADNLVSGSEILMGESNEQIPVVIVRGCDNSIFRDTDNLEAYNKLMKMDPEQCIYMGPVWPKI